MGFFQARGDYSPALRACASVVGEFALLATTCMREVNNLRSLSPALKIQPPKTEVVCLWQAFLPTYGCGRGGTRTPDFYCVIVKSHRPMCPIRPFRAFLFGFLHFSGV